MMIMIKRLYIIALLTLVTTALAVAHTQEPDFPELESNSHYMSLKQRSAQLLEREDSIQQLIATAREEFDLHRDSIMANNAIDAFASYILKLESDIFELREQRGDVITEINNIEQEYILAHMYSKAHQEEGKEDAEEVVEEIVTPVEYRELIKNTIFVDALNTADYTELVEAHNLDNQMDSLCNQYNDLYAELYSTAREYRQTEIESEADSLFGRFHSLKRRASELNDDIEQRWNYIIDTKYYAYGYILELNHKYDLLDSSSEAFSQMRIDGSHHEGLYESDAVMHYAIGRPTLLDFEIAVAQELDLEEACDSLKQVRSTLSVPEYRNEALQLAKRLFIDYQPVVIGRTNHYNTTNPVPELKVYEQGTIYRILLGSFRSKQPMTLFKGVQPLYITTNEEGNYEYYTGGFDSLIKAEETQLFLKDKGFKQPEICRWTDGQMVNISQQREDDDQEEIVLSRYMVVVGCETMEDAMRSAIEATAPDKMISRRGSQFVIGTFNSRADASHLVEVLTEQFPDVDSTLLELDIQ